MHTGDVVARPWPELDDDAEIEQWCAWLAEVWSQVPVAEAVAVASPVLATASRRCAVGCARYLVRMRGRATPFGVFAGVAALRFGPRFSARWTDDHYVRTRADTVWLAAVIASLESCPALRRHLPVTLNDLVVVRGERLVLPWHPRAGDPGHGTSVEVSVRHSPRGCGRCRTLPTSR
ncbi:MAG: lantibiotic dehydratase [Pseudonocardiaceae bacterium]